MMLCLKKRKTYSFTQGACADLPRRSKKDKRDDPSNMTVTTLPRNHKSREDRPSRMGLTVTEDTPADMLAGSMELLVQLPREHNIHTQRVTVPRSTPMMDLLVQVATAHKLAASSYTLQAIGERGMVLSHHPNTPIGALDALQVKLLPKQGTFVPRKVKQPNQPFETTFRLQVHLPRNQLYVSRVSPKMNLGDILDEVCREKNLDRGKYELRHPANVEEVLDLSLSLQDYHLQEVTLCPKHRALGSALSSQDIMALQRQEERRRQQAKQGVFGFMFKKSKESSVSTDSLGGRSVSPARSDETARSSSPQAPPPRPQRKRRPAPKPPVPGKEDINENGKEKSVISHSRNSSDSSGYHEASVLSDNPDSNSRVPESLSRRSKLPANVESPRKLAQTSEASKSLGNLAMSGGMSHGVSNTSLSSTGLRKKKAAPPPPKARPLSSAISTQALERIVDSEESLTSDMDISKPPSDIATSSKANSDIGLNFKIHSDISADSVTSKPRSVLGSKTNSVIEVASQISSNVEKTDLKMKTSDVNVRKSNLEIGASAVKSPEVVEPARVEKRAVGKPAPIPLPRASSYLESITPTSMKISRARETRPSPKPRLHSRSIDDLPSMEDQPQFSMTTDTINQHNAENTSSSLGGTTSTNNSTMRKNGQCSKKQIPQTGHHVRKQTSGQEDNKVVKSMALRIDGLGRIPDEIVNSTSGTGYVKNGMQQEERDTKRVPKKPRRKTLENSDLADVNNEIDQIKHEQETSRLKSRSLEANRGNTEKATRLTKTKNLTTTSVVTAAKLMNKPEHFSKVPGDEIKNSRSPTLSNGSNVILNFNNLKQQFQKSSSVAKEPSGKHPKQIDIYTSSQEENGNVVSNRTNYTENRRSCAVISTIPKCDRFQIKEPDIDVDEIIQQIVETVDQERQKLKNVQRHCDANKNKGSLGSSFGAGKSILDYESDVKKRSTSGVRSDDELEDIDNLDMFESMGVAKRPIIRSRSDMNGFEIHTSNRRNRSMGSQSEDIAFAINPNFPTDFSPEMFENRFSTRQIKSGSRVNSSGKDLPAFLTAGANLGLRMNLEGLEDDACPTTWDLGESGSGDGLSETDILLRKVSDTLSGSLQTPPPSPNETPILNDNRSSTKSNAPNARPIVSNETTQTLQSTQKLEKTVKDHEPTKKHLDISPDGTILRASTPNMTVTSGQDTSDYVSATGEDLSVSEWEYQLPAPPSAFRDADSPSFNGYETITLGSVEAFKEPIAHIVDQPLQSKKAASKMEATLKETASKESSKIFSKKSPEPEVHIQVVPPTPVEKKSMANESLEMKKEVISELENKIEIGRLSQTSVKSCDSETRRVSNISSTPSVAPVDNTLSNFTITTYSKQKNLDIFDEDAGKVTSLSRKNSELMASRNSVNQDDYNSRKNSEMLKTLRTRTTSENSNGSVNSRRSSATLGRDFVVRKISSSSVQSVERSPSDVAEFKKPAAPKIFKQNENSLYRRQSFNDDNDKSAIVHRSKSYITLANNSRYRSDSIGENARAKSITNLNVVEDIGTMQKSISVSSLNQEMPRSNEKFSQWRENILKRQEEPTKEKQLQSLQVLKSILPQLKGTQQTEENVSEQSREEHSENRSNTLPNERPAEKQVVPSNTESQSKTEPDPRKLEPEEQNTKRYSYAGPPAINFGSWSERPRVSVQIKNDTDYKFGKNNTSGAKTIINLNSSRDEVDFAKSNGTTINELPKNEVKTNSVQSQVRQPGSKEPVELITHTTAPGSKSATIKKFGSSGAKVQSKVEHKPVVTAVELKRSTTEKQQESSKKQEEEIDTRPINFRELTKTFGREINLRTKPKYATQNRHSEYYSVKPEITQNFTKTDANRIGYVSSNDLSQQVETAHNGRVSNGTQNVTTKKYTSVVGINSQNGNFANYSVKNNENSMKIAGGPMPVVKGFKIQATRIDQTGEVREAKTPHVANGNVVKHNGLSVVNSSKNSAVPKAPTMPVIMGVTLKSANARPKSMPISADPRDQLLDSIRNFGGRDMLRSATQRF